MLSYSVFYIIDLVYFGMQVYFHSKFNWLYLILPSVRQRPTSAKNPMQSVKPGSNKRIQQTFFFTDEKHSIGNFRFILCV